MELKLHLGFYQKQLCAWREGMAIELRGDKCLVDDFVLYLMKYHPAITSEDDSAQFKVE
jgi:hypothetical protein